MEQGLALALMIVLTSVLTGTGVLLIFAALTPRSRSAGALDDKGCQDAVFLFDQGLLIDTSAQGARLLDTLLPGGRGQRNRRAWQALAAYLGQRFPDFDCSATWPGQDTESTLASSDDSLILRQEWIAGSLRMTLHEKSDAQGVVVMDRLSHGAMTQEIDILRQALDLAPTAIWAENDRGRVTWANGAYLKLLCRAQPDVTLVWPLPRLFEPLQDGDRSRVGLHVAGGQVLWFDLFAQASSAGTLHFAQPADLAQQAEQSRKQFVQTLTRAFATLPTGLAVFDKTRRLQVFNPALTELTRLEPEFLLSCPGLEGFLNRLREKRTLPEPRDYQAWSRRLLEIERAATGVDFEEDWVLGDGRVLRVTARPHPDGALAFLIEDASASSDLSRQARAGLETLGDLLEILPAPIAVFAADGALQMANSAFSALTSSDAQSLDCPGLTDTLALWAREGLGGDALLAMRKVVAGHSKSTRVTTRIQGQTHNIQMTRTTRGAIMMTLEPQTQRTLRKRPAETERLRHTA
jgi:PAS domain-containing protein